jgi:hypothetical protein
MMLKMKQNKPYKSSMKDLYCSLGKSDLFSHIFINFSSTYFENVNRNYLII